MEGGNPQDYGNLQRGNSVINGPGLQCVSMCRASVEDGGAVQNRHVSQKHLAPIVRIICMEYHIVSYHLYYTCTCMCVYIYAYV